MKTKRDDDDPNGVRAAWERTLAGEKEPSPWWVDDDASSSRRMSGWVVLGLWLVPFVLAGAAIWRHS